MAIQKSKYKNASVVLVGIACTTVLVRLFARLSCIDLPYDQQWNVMKEVYPLCSISTPILFAWIGVLLRRRLPTPKLWVKITLLALPVILYAFWSVSHHFGHHGMFDGVRCLWIMAGLVGYLLPHEQIIHYSDDKGWFDLAVTVGIVFVYVGIVRVTDHFTAVNFQMLEGEWTRLFHRLMRAIPLAISLAFLILFSFSRIGQRMGSSKVFGWYSQIVAVLYSSWVFSWQMHWLVFRTNLFALYSIVSTPVMVYLLVVLGRFIKRKKDGRKPFRDLFEEAPTVEQVHDSAIASEPSEKDLNIGTE